MLKTCIIGAGVSGIMLAKSLEDAFILEKSNGIGGRLAARRLGQYSLNHGPKEFSMPPGNKIISDPHAWIKIQANGLNILKAWEVSYLKLHSDKITIHGKRGEEIDCAKLILTAPAPQAFEILTKSGLSADFLKSVSYKSVIQFMLQGDSKTEITELCDYLDLKGFVA